MNDRIGKFIIRTWLALCIIALIVVGVLFWTRGLRAQTQVPVPKVPPLELKVADGRGAQCIMTPVIECGLIPTDEHGSMHFSYDPVKKTGWFRINRPVGDIIVGDITQEAFVTQGNKGILLLGFSNGYFTGSASFTLYPFVYNYSAPGQRTHGIMLTAGAVRVEFYPEGK